MASVTTRSFKQTNGYFVVPVAQPSSLLYKVNAAASGSGGSALPPSFTVATALPSAIFSGANVLANTMLKDMGKTVVSSTHTFRKVQVVSQSGPLTDNSDVCYIELTTTAALQGGALKVAFLPGLW